MEQLQQVRTFVVVRDQAGREIGRVETTNCWWCGEHVCAACSAKAQETRK